VVDITTPAIDSAIVGDSIPFGFNLTNARGDFFFGKPFTLTFSDSTVIKTLSQTWEHAFWLQAIKVGSTFVKVTSGGRSDSSRIIVEEPAVTPVDPRAARYEAVDLGTLGGETAFPLALNDNGQVVGYSLTASGAQHAFLWDNGVMRDLGKTGDQSSAAHVITNSGIVAGVSWFGSGPQHVWVWQGGVRKDLGSVGCCDQSTVVIGITATDVVARGDQGSAIWQSGVKQDLGMFARAMNSRRQVVGMTGGRPVMWDNGVMRELEVWWGPGEAVDINTGGLVVGHLVGALGDMGVAWVDAKYWRDVGWVLPVAVNDSGDIASDLAGTGYFLRHEGSSITIGSMATGTKVAAMNDRAVIVGSSWNASKKQFAFAWQPGEASLIDLGGPSTTDRQGSAATAVNARGDILGWVAPCTTPSGRCTELDKTRARAILWRLR
jgi:probable HAF family extracellular repeat protein